MAQGQRMLIVAGEDDRLDRLGKALWNAAPEEFLANGRAGGAHDARQPILLSTDCAAANGASLLALADGVWREEAAAFPRVLLFFDDSGRPAARETWRQFDGQEGIEREFFELESGNWRRKA